ncbi:MAG: hypothetical protein ACTINM_10005, partial [Acetobacter cibinongensis]
LFGFYVIGYQRNVKDHDALVDAFTVSVALCVFSVSFFIIALSWIATFFVRFYFKKKYKHEKMKFSPS